MTAFPRALLDGYRRFLRQQRRAPQFYRRLAGEGQKPEIMVIGCCDSRAAPEIIFQSAPGDIFVVRNIANQVPPFEPDGHFHGTSAALEYAVKALKVKHILVLGHGGCGGVQAALAAGGQEKRGQEAVLASAKTGTKGQEAGSADRLACGATGTGDNAASAAAADFIADWMQLLKPAARQVCADARLTQAQRQRALERISLRFSLQNLRSFPWIKQAEREGRLALHAAWFEIGAAALWLLDEAGGQFFPLAPPRTQKGK